jgi:hypothetical protein
LFWLGETDAHCCILLLSENENNGNKKAFEPLSAAFSKLNRELENLNEISAQNGICAVTDVVYANNVFGQYVL